MSFQRLIGQKDLKIRLKHEYLGDPNHAAIFTGAKGSGRHEFAREYAKALMCSSPTDDGACGKCNNCTYFDAGTHPDLIVLADPNKKTIKVDEVRNKVVSDVKICPQISRRKVYLIEGDELNEAGQNALLKSLEEPPANIIFILICEDSEKLLPTVLSRTVEYKLSSYSKDEIMDALRRKNKEEFDGKYSEDELKFTCEFSSNVLGKALDLLGDEELPSMRDKCFEIITNIGKEGYCATLTDRYSYFDANADNIREILLLMLWIFGDLSILKKDRNNKNITNTDKRDVMLKFLDDNPSVDLNKISKAAGHITTVFKRLDLNVNFLYAVGDMLLGIKKELT